MSNLAVVPNTKLSTGFKAQVFIPHPNIIVKDDNIIYEVKKDMTSGEISHIRIGRRLEIVQASKFLEDGKRIYNLKIHTKEGIVIEENVNRSILGSKDELFKTIEKGSDVNNLNYKYYWMDMQNQEEQLKNADLKHKTIGWDEYNGETIYKHTKTISVDNKIESVYEGPRLIETKGTLEEYEQFVKEEVIGHIGLEAAIGLGLSAVVVGILENYNTNIFHLYGNSTTGKTTTGELIISLASKPTFDEGGLMLSYKTTDNALIGNLRNIYGVPVLIDDNSLADKTNFSPLIYQIALGKDKERLDKNGDLRPVASWQTTVVSNGETTLLGGNENEGSRVRIFEFENVPWTQDSAHADRIKTKIQLTYGHGVLVVAEALLKLTKEEIASALASFEKAGKEYLVAKNNVNGLTDRKLKVYATVRYGLELFEQEVALGFHMKEVEEFLLDHMFKEVERMWEKALEALLSYVESNRNSFHREVLYDLSPKPVKLNLESKSFNTVLGKISDEELETVVDDATGEDKRVVKREVSILKAEFNKILKDLGFTNPGGILKDFKDNDIISCDSDRLTRKRKINSTGGQVTTVVIKVEVDYIETEEMQLAYHSNVKREKTSTVGIRQANSRSIIVEAAQDLDDWDDTELESSFDPREEVDDTIDQDALNMEEALEEDDLWE